MASTPADRILAHNGPILLSALLGDTRFYSAAIADQSRELYAAATRAAPNHVDAVAVVTQLRYMIRGLSTWFYPPRNAAAMIGAMIEHFGITDGGAARASLSVREVASIHNSMANCGTEEQYEILQQRLRVPNNAWILFVCAVLSYCRSSTAACTGPNDDGDAHAKGRYDPEYENIFTNAYATTIAEAVAHWFVLKPPVPRTPDKEDSLWWHDPMPAPPPGCLAHLPSWAKQCAVNPAFAANMGGARRRLLGLIIYKAVGAAKVPHLPAEIINIIVACAMP